MPWFSIFNLHQGPSSRVGRAGWVLRTCISNKFLDTKNGQPGEHSLRTLTEELLAFKPDWTLEQRKAAASVKNSVATLEQVVIVAWVQILGYNTY